MIRNMEIKNVLVLNMSTIRKDRKFTYYFKRGKKDGSIYLFWGANSLEPGSKYLLNKLARKGEKIDKFIVVCSPETIEGSENGAFEDYVRRINFYHMMCREGKISATRIRSILFEDEINNKYAIEDSLIRNIEIFIDRYVKNKGKTKIELLNKYVEGLKKEIHAHITDLGIKVDYRIADNCTDMIFFSKICQGDILNCEIILSEDFYSTLYRMEAQLTFISVAKESQGKTVVERVREEILGLEADQINVYMDMQGGERTFAFVINDVITLLHNKVVNHKLYGNLKQGKEKRVVFKDRYSVKYSYTEYIHEIVNETGNYYINDLVSAMDSFTNYGKAELLIEYLDRIKQQNKQKNYVNEDKIVDIIKDISDAIQISDPKEFDNSLNHFSDFLKVQKKWDDPYFSFLVNDIYQDYGVLLKDEKNVIDMIAWCLKKGYIQQALTYIEDKMPALYFDGVIEMIVEKNGSPVHAKDEKEWKKYCRYIHQPSYEKRESNVHFYGSVFWLMKYQESEFLRGCLEAILTKYILNYQPDFEKFLGRVKSKKVFTNFIGEKYPERDIEYKFETSKPIDDEDNMKVIQQVLEDYFLFLKDYPFENFWDTDNFMRDTLRCTDGNEFGYGNMKENILLEIIKDKDIMVEYKKTNIKSVNEDELVRKHNRLLSLSETDDIHMFEENCPEFVSEYSDFRNLNDIYERGTFISIHQVDFYDKNKELLSLFGIDIPECRVLRENEKKYSLAALPAKNDLGEGYTLNLRIKKDRKTFKQLMILHDALKRERNQSNHASEKGIRLKAKVIKRAIDYYIYLYHKLFV